VADDDRRTAITHTFLVVVVVVVAMAEKILSENVVLRRVKTAQNENNVRAQYRFDELRDYNGEMVDVRVEEYNQNKSKEIANYETKVYETEPGITLRKSVIESNDLKPGSSVRFTIHELPEDEPAQDFVDNASVIGRCEAIADQTTSDGLDARLYSGAVCNWLNEKQKLVVYRNTRTGLEVSQTAKPYKESKAFSFPAKAREEIQAKPGDCIEILKIETRPNENTGSDFDEIKEVVESMHDMVQELYDAYENDD
jgi:hypothetical protein